MCDDPITTQTMESMAVGGTGVGVADMQRSLGSGGEGAGPPAGGEERSSTAVSGNALMEAIDITTNGTISLSLSLSFCRNLS